MSDEDQTSNVKENNKKNERDDQNENYENHFRSLKEAKSNGNKNDSAFEIMETKDKEAIEDEYNLRWLLRHIFDILAFVIAIIAFIFSFFTWYINYIEDKPKLDCKYEGGYFFVIDEQSNKSLPTTYDMIAIFEITITNLSARPDYITGLDHIVYDGKWGEMIFLPVNNADLQNLDNIFDVANYFLTKRKINIEPKLSIITRRYSTYINLNKKIMDDPTYYEPYNSHNGYFIIKFTKGIKKIDGPIRVTIRNTRNNTYSVVCDNIIEVPKLSNGDTTNNYNSNARGP
ncbi:MAG TPA: hypothetical protein VM658_17035 [bacterium]|nr:hypothetical protein [bacterium]